VDYKHLAQPRIATRSSRRTAMEVRPRGGIVLAPRTGKGRHGGTTEEDATGKRAVMAGKEAFGALERLRERGVAVD